jgi:hypothetical protein
MKLTDFWPTGSVTQPWLPRYLAVRRHAVRQRDADRLAGTIDDWLAELAAHLVGSGEIADILGGEVGVER